MAPTILETEYACLDRLNAQSVTRNVRLQWGNWLWTLVEVRQQRRALLSLDDRMLADIGLSRADATHEGMRALHDLPQPDNQRRRCL